MMWVFLALTFVFGTISGLLFWKDDDWSLVIGIMCLIFSGTLFVIFSVCCMQTF